MEEKYNKKVISYIYAKFVGSNLRIIGDQEATSAIVILEKAEITIVNNKKDIKELWKGSHTKGLSKDFSKLTALIANQIEKYSLN